MQFSCANNILNKIWEKIFWRFIPSFNFLNKKWFCRISFLQFSETILISLEKLITVIPFMEYALTPFEKKFQFQLDF
jgi:hypothetical protein